MRLRNDVSITRWKARNCWLVRWHGKYDPAKDKQQRYGKSFKRKKDAERFAQSLKNDIQDGVSIEPNNINLQNLCNRFIETKKNNKRPDTIRAYLDTTKRLISTFGAHRNIKSISGHEAQDFINNMELFSKDKSPSDSTRLKHLTNSKIIFNQAIKWQYIKNNPFKDISISDISKEDWHYITPAEFQSLLKAIDNIKLKNKMEQQDKE